MTLERYPAPPCILSEAEEQVSSCRRSYTSLRTLVLERARCNPHGKVARIVRDLNSTFIAGAKRFTKTWHRDCEPRVQASETAEAFAFAPPPPPCVLAEEEK